MHFLHYMRRERGMTDMEGIRLICAKELSRVFKDKKMILSVFIFPVALMIVIMSVTSNMAQSAEDDVEAHRSVIYVENAPDGFVEFLEQSETPCDVYTAETVSSVLSYEMADAQDQLSVSDTVKEGVVQGTIDLIIEFPEGFFEQVEQYRTGLEIPQIKTYYNPSEEYSSAAYETVSGGVLEQYRQSLLARRITDMEQLVVFTVNSDNPDMVLQDDSKAGGKILGMLLPYFITILLFAGAMGVGADMIAGEKERGTMASLLVSPVRRSSIVLGKVFALMIISGTSAIVYVAAMVAFMPQMMGGMNGADMGIDLSLQPSQIVMLAVLLIGVAFLYATIVVLVSVFAKSVKEASSYIMPVYILILILGIMTMFTTKTSEDLMYAIPIYNISLALQGILTSEINGVQYGLSVGVTFVLGGILIAVIAKVFESEKVMSL